MNVMIEWEKIKDKSKKISMEAEKMKLLKEFKNVINSIRGDNSYQEENENDIEIQKDLKINNKSEKFEEEVVMLNADTLEKKVLPEIRSITEANHLEGIFILDTEGLPLISYSFLKLDEDMFAASSASIVSSSQLISSDLGKGSISRISIETDEGIIVFSQIDDYIIAIMSRENIKLGILRGAISKVENLLKTIK